MLKLSATNLYRHKLRTMLSVLGIVLGVASLIALVSVVDGIRGDIQDAFTKAQGVRVTPLKSTDPVFNSIDDSWVGKLEKIQGVKVAVGNILQPIRNIDGKAQQPYNGPRLVGIDVAKSLKASSSGFSGELLEGRDFQSGDSGVVLIGKKIKKDFDKFLGSKIRINGTNFKIIGVYTTGSDLLDQSVLLPIEDARKVSNFPNGKVSYINLELVSPKDDKTVANRVNLVYGDKLKATSLSDFSQQFGQIFDDITALVVIIASIASIVAAVGIINTMLMSVLERFREIGALKAVGWTQGNIIKMVILESLFIGVIGGGIGVLVGVFASGAIKSFGLSVVITPKLMLGSFFGAVLVGTLAGVYPSLIASRMDPVEALRAE